MKPAVPEAPPGLSVTGLSFRYGERTVLDAVTFVVRRGRFTALLGPNGAGKTTLFSLCLRLLAAPQGRIAVEGRDMAREGPAALRPVGIVYQEPTLDLDLTVRQNLRYFAALRGIAQSEADAAIRAGLTTSGLAETLDRRARSLSAGQRRRVELVRALMHQPTLLLLDEATTGLDVPSREALVRQVHDLARDGGVGVLWATHIIDEVEEGDDVVILDRGKVVASGPVAEVVRRAGADGLRAAYAALTAPAAA